MATLENQLELATQDIASYIQSDSVLTQAAHAQRLQDDPEWGLILGLGYQKGSQKQSLIYKHLTKLLDSLRSITGGDAMKAKELSEMLFLRTHAGILSL